MEVSELKKYIVPGVRAHLIGIGGVSMSPLAEVLNTMGLKVSGSDVSEGAAVDRLRSLGISVAIGHRAGNIEGADFIVRTAAVHDENPEIAAAKAAGIPVFERAQAWGYIMRGYENALCVSGTHGKTTTTSMCTQVLLEAGADPTVMIGGTLPLLGSGYRIGKGGTIVAESCEYYNSFLSFAPTVAVILNIEADHLDFFKDLEDVKSSFRRFAELVPEDKGLVVYNGDDKNTCDALRGLDRSAVTFGFDEKNDYHPANVSVSSGKTQFDLIGKGENLGRVSLLIPGKHNILNALAAAAALMRLGTAPESIIKGLSSFTGAKRRFEYKGEINGALVYDDYAHHPGELKALIDAAETLNFKRMILVFQPHTYTRTKALFDDFVEQLKRPDMLYLAEIYAAREKNTIGISSRDLAERIPGALFCPTFTNIEENLKAVAKPGDIIFTVGAGDIYRVGENIVE